MTLMSCLVLVMSLIVLIILNLSITVLANGATQRNLHIQDAVQLLDGKGFTCYWAGENRLWRISGCYFEHYNFFHDWSNVACVHRSQEILYDRMEKVFTNLLEAW